MTREADLSENSDKERGGEPNFLWRVDLPPNHRAIKIREKNLPNVCEYSRSERHGIEHRAPLFKTVDPPTPVMFVPGPVKPKNTFSPPPWLGKNVNRYRGEINIRNAISLGALCQYRK